MITKYPAKVESLLVNEKGRSISLFFDISELDGDEPFDRLQTDPVLDLRHIQMHGSKKLELRVEDPPREQRRYKSRSFLSCNTE